MVLNRLHTNCCSSMAFAGSGAADQHDIFSCFNELAPMQLPDCCLVDLTGRKIKAGEVFVCGEAGDLELLVNLVSGRFE